MNPDETYKEFEERFNKEQEKKYQEKSDQLEKEFPLQERIIAVEQMKTNEKLKREAEEKEQEMEEAEELIDVSQFKPISTTELVKILGLTIKRDEINKLLTFLAELSAYTEDSQLNISFNAPSSSGKSFIPTEIANLFPQKDLIEVAYCSPTAFFHDYGEFNKEKGGYTVDLSRKILIFLDQPHTMLLQHLRPMLSHDKKEIRLKITDKSQKAGLRTKNIYLIGFPTVIFCTAGLNLDEQEATRFLLLSPEVNQEKIREAIFEKVKKEANNALYKYELESNPERQVLKDRILAIKQELIREIKIGNPTLVQEMFLKRAKILKPRHQRDIGRVISLVKVFALLNLWFRERNGMIITANEDDIQEAFKVWDAISESQELGLPPFVYNLYKDVVVTAYKDKNGEPESVVKIGLARQDIMQKHYEVYGRFPPTWQLKDQIIPLLEASGLITQEQDPTDRRKALIYPTTLLSISKTPNNEELNGGVTESESTQAELSYMEETDES
ncbi:hypothetical protein A3D79_02245 [Candidatus Daviesbacteria bacterium RIFCSPHIGHO2_02_FULL_39_8]|nr:MAG: hypothetical protein A3D79_02245 [Candidatus Daviesbacteria bacterium RIFCSPHIGHO2_02_FULL_39_8]